MSEPRLAPLVKGLQWSRRGLELDGAWVARHLATAVLAEWLYERLFTAWRPPSGRFGGDVAGAPAFVEELLVRSAGRTFLDREFQLTQRTPAGSFVSDGRIRLWVEDEGALVPRRARLGQPVAVRLPCARPAAVPGYFTVVSRVGRVPAEPHLRLYLALGPQGALELVDALLHDPALVRARFEAAVVNDPAAYRRRDTAMLSVHPASWARVAAWLVGFHARHRRHFRRGAPPLTLPLAPGISAAESAPGEESYGEHRCRLIATGVIAALRRGEPWLAGVRRAFDAEGLRFDTPWLGSLGTGWVDRTPRRWL